MFLKKIQFFTFLYFSASMLHGSEDHEHDAVLKQILRAHRQYQQMIAQNPIPEDRKLTPKDADIYHKLRFGSHQSNLKDETKLLLNPNNHWLVNRYDDEFQDNTPIQITMTHYTFEHSMMKSPKAFKIYNPSVQTSKLYALMLLAAGANPDQNSASPRDTARDRAPECIAECEHKIKTLKQEENEKLAVAALLTQTTRNCVLAIVFSQLLDHDTQS
jgi:hypothetical protein